ncbi:MAG: hypothetical protein P1P67_10150 [Treponema phagedenis]|nr:hypothetical protein [Treponema phagedenis]NVP23080.1 hypothetical protein [Treponema phagedenis]QEJ95035.1 hypothetical protein FUT79_07370 [Treponema phagedenis]QEJ98119.1 hypothetical protein FUT82_08985 [Treponema phagedenis]QEK00960.1 hypothetical protein FUT84_07215 [Treponema phagedenis]QEK03627.1 hypothetical protein FUT83_07290 [Treponema phagedenis]
MYIPVAPNKALLYEILEGNNNAKDIKKVLNRTKAVYAGFFIESNEFRICSSGGYPFSLTNMLFPKSKGWKPGKTAKGIRYYQSGYMDISIPSGNTACVVLGSTARQDMNDFLAKLDNPQPVSLSSRFEALMNASDAAPKKNIGVFITNSQYFLAKVTGIANLDLPLGAIEMHVIKKEKTNDYTYSLSVEADNNRAAFAVRFLLAKVLNGKIGGTGNSITVEDGTIPSEKLAALIKTLYLH